MIFHRRTLEEAAYIEIDGGRDHDAVMLNVGHIKSMIGTLDHPVPGVLILSGSMPRISQLIWEINEFEWRANPFTTMTSGNPMAKPHAMNMVHRSISA